MVKKEPDKTGAVVSIDPGTKGAGIALFLCGRYHSSAQISPNGSLAKLAMDLSGFIDSRLKHLHEFGFDRRTVVVERQFQNKRCIAAQGVCEAQGMISMRAQHLVLLWPQTWMAPLKQLGKTPRERYMEFAKRAAHYREFGSKEHDEAAAVAMGEVFCSAGTGDDGRKERKK